MFAYIKGRLEEKKDTYVVIDVGGVGYKIFMPTKSIENVGELGETVKIHTYYYVREDYIGLYGFASLEELRLFELLLSVSGIGAKSAVAMLSEISPSSFALAVITDDVNKLTKIPGVGKKSAARIILELKDKLKNAEITNLEENEETPIVPVNENANEAVAALQVLGYTKKEVEKVLEKIDTNTLSVEEIIKISLKNLAR